MKQLKTRTLFVLIFTFLLIGGMVFFLIRYGLYGEDWASFASNTHAFSNGQISSGAIYDRNDTLLYSCADGAYSEDYTTRVSTLHAVGDVYGSIGTGAKSVFADELVGYSWITGTSGTGNSLTLTIDAKLNNTAYEALDGRKGTVALYNYKTGELLCMVSAPSYDPTDDDLISAINAGDSDYDGAYVNRFLSATFTPGSTFKLVTSAAAIETYDDLDDFSFDCDETITVDGNLITCPSPHGEQTFGEALTNSCNGAFATLALKVGGDTLKDYAQKAGLLSSLSVSGISTASGSFTAEAANSAALAWSGVGQDKNLVNPASMLTLMGCIAGDGSAATPCLLKSVTNRYNISTTKVSGGTSKIDWSASTCARLREMMRNNVKNKYVNSLDFYNLPVCAKSGTAEVGGGNDPHAWFVGFIDSEEYPYAFVVLVENGGWGSTVAGSVASQLLAAIVE